MQGFLQFGGDLGDDGCMGGFQIAVLEHSVDGAGEFFLAADAFRQDRFEFLVCHRRPDTDPPAMNRRFRAAVRIGFFTLFHDERSNVFVDGCFLKTSLRAPVLRST